MKLNQNQYAGKDRDKKEILTPGSIYVATDTKKIYFYDDAGVAILATKVLGDEIANTYSELSSFEKENTIAFVLNSQGARWLPGNLGGSYYPSGWYVFKLGNWVHSRYDIDDQIGLNTNLITGNKTSIDNHVIRNDNPHSITKSQIGLGNVDNTSDAGKPVSSAMLFSLNSKVDAVAGQRLITSLEAAKISNLEGVNTGDQDISNKVDKVLFHSLTKNNLTDVLKSSYDSAVSWVVANGTNILNHLSSNSNPHSVSKSDVGLGSVPNTDFTDAVALNTEKETNTLYDDQPIIDSLEEKVNKLDDHELVKVSHLIHRTKTSIRQDDMNMKLILK
jgi:hypothetical protein